VAGGQEGSSSHDDVAKTYERKETHLGAMIMWRICCVYRKRLWKRYLFLVTWEMITSSSCIQLFVGSSVTFLWDRRQCVELKGLGWMSVLFVWWPCQEIDLNGSRATRRLILSTSWLFNERDILL
jgi:hypothetical protein